MSLFQAGGLGLQSCSPDVCTALSNCCWHQSLEHLFPNSPSLLPFPSFIISPAVIHGARQLAGEGSTSLPAFSATASISWLLSTQESSPVDIISTLEGAITFCRLLAKLSLTVHPTCPAVPIGWDLNKFSKPFYHWLLFSFLGGQQWKSPAPCSHSPRCFRGPSLFKKPATYSRLIWFSRTLDTVLTEISRRR